MTDYYCTLRGSLTQSGVSDIFQQSIAIQSNGNAEAVATALGSSWRTAWNNVTNNITGMYTPGVSYSEATAAQILNLGPTDPQVAAAYHHQLIPPIAGTSGASGVLPPQCAVAVSLWGGTRTNGSRIKGRFYMPPPAVAATTAGGVLSPVYQGALLDAMTEFLSSLGTAGHMPMVWSRTEAKLTGLTKLRIGSRVDTIRSRRNAMPETYSEELFIP